MDRLTPEQRRRNMQAIRSKNTKIEIILGKALWAAGYRYRKNDKKVLGKPDFVFKKQKVAVFCDSEFWHGKDWDVQQKRIGTNKDFWINKIQKNVNRDMKINEELKSQGWKVIRFWETEIKKNIGICVTKVIECINS
jgi:DNA mismatch endonuclease (patch repair protein)